MNELESAKALVIRQRKEWGEILSGFEQRNCYEIMDSQGRTLFLAQEHAGGRGLGMVRRKFAWFRRRYQVLEASLKAVLLGAVFLIDFVHFENRGKN